MQAELDKIRELLGKKNHELGSKDENEDSSKTSKNYNKASFDYDGSSKNPTLPMINPGKRRRLEVSLPAVSPGHRFAGRGGAPRDRRVVAALAGEQTVSQPSLSEILASVAVSGGEILVFSGVFFFFWFLPN
jgi:hypothetical protein